MHRVFLLCGGGVLELLGKKGVMGCIFTGYNFINLDSSNFNEIVMGHYVFQGSKWTEFSHTVKPDYKFRTKCMELH